jgi:hypothetical protein
MKLRKRTLLCGSRPLGLPLDRLLLMVAIAFSTPSRAAAQIDNHFAVGVNFTTRSAGSAMAEGHNSVGVQWRFGHTDEGWGWQHAFNWFEADVRQPIGDRSTDFGRLHVRPLMGGYGYSWIVGRAAITASVLGGYAFTTFKLEPVADDEYRARLGARSVRADVANTFVAKPELKVWYDLGQKFGLTVMTGYIVARPTVTVTSSLGKDRRPIRADMFVFRVGLAYSIF